MNEQPNWDRSVIEKLAMSALTEQRRARQWRIFFRLIWLLLTLTLLWAIFFRDNEKVDALSSREHTALINLDGVIDSQSDIANKLIDGLEAAYKDNGTKGVIIRANSPGGSPVLSGLAYDEIRRLRKLHPTIPVYVVVEDVCASGCYYIASAADKIFVDKASIIGSIGVLQDGFGFTGAMAKLGVERRLLTAGQNKAMGDPFSPVNPKQQEIVKTLLNDIHQQFITAVKQGRGNRLKADPDMFSGRIWIGEQGVPLGLADGLGNVRSVARDIIKADKLVDVTPEDDITRRVARRFGVSLGEGFRSLFETRLF
ncbi:S49 family peptidase [Crenobacter sp. SG2303]|uniref:S49 family peptidase n=2 Tax=Crenobacter oryzisoli TaxID=3056844 RepID=A0ABT7XRJ6_9NEIS|nr:S49 family peptidase [Crenobacter sp. SG2303]MDN0076340.1 S49 family peptidase [Crenobacter sp. SG2303]